jgi:hypothetical protein
MNFSPFCVNKAFMAQLGLNHLFSKFALRWIKVPFFEPDDASALSTQNLDVAHIIDLGGKGVIEALALVEAALMSHQGADETRLWFRFDPPTGETPQPLFQPVGRKLRDAIAQGKAVRAMPVQAGGWIVRLASKVR